MKKTKTLRNVGLTALLGLSACMASADLLLTFNVSGVTRNECTGLLQPTCALTGAGGFSTQVRLTSTALAAPSSSIGGGLYASEAFYAYPVSMTGSPYSAGLSSRVVSPLTDSQSFTQLNSDFDNTGLTGIGSSSALITTDRVSDGQDINGNLFHQEYSNYYSLFTQGFSNLSLFSNLTTDTMTQFFSKYIGALAGVFDEVGTASKMNVSTGVFSSYAYTQYHGDVILAGVQTVPEPDTLALMLLAAAGAAGVRRSRKARAARVARSLALTAVGAASFAAFAGDRDDTAIPPIGFSTPRPDSATETQSMFDRADWIQSRFSGRLDKDFFTRTLAQIQAQAARHPELLVGAVAAPAFVPKWKSIGPVAAQVAQNGIILPAVDSGRVRNILPHPTDPNTVTLLSSGGGLWKTTNFNAIAPTWKALTDATVTTSGGSAALGSNPNTIYLGLGDPFDGIALVGGVMVRSTDGGNTFSAPIDIPTATIIGDVKVDTSVATDMVLVATNGGLYRSVDGGLSYNAVAGIPTTRNVTSIVKTSAGWLAAAFTSTANYGIGNSAVMYLSTDGGATFAPIANTGNGYKNAARATLAVGLPGDSVVYAVANNADNVSGLDRLEQRDVFRSADGGNTWIALGLDTKFPANINPDQPNMDILNGQAWYNQMLVVDSTDAARNTLHLGGNLSTAKSTDGGATWRIQTNWLAQFGLPYSHADHHAAAITNIGGKKRIFFGNDGGIFVSDDDGATFTDRKNIGLVNHLTYSLATSGADTNSVITGLQDNGTRLRVSGTGVFNETFGGDGFGVGWSQANGNAVLGSYVYNFIYFTNVAPTDQALWTEPGNDGTCLAGYNGLETCNSYFYTTVYTPSAAADPTGKVFYARSFNDVWRTTDAGGLWKSISLTDPTRGSNNVRSAPHVIGVHPTDGNKIAAAASGRRVRISTDGGTTWVTRQLPTTVSDGFNSNVAWVNDKVMFVASENVSFQTSGCWLARTGNLGVSWSKSCTGLPQVPISKVLVSPADPSGLTAYAATWIGVYKTTNGGVSWDQFGAGLPVVKVSDMYMPARGGFLRISTYGRGIWEIPTAR